MWQYQIVREGIKDHLSPVKGGGGSGGKGARRTDCLHMGGGLACLMACRSSSATSRALQGGREQADCR